MEKCDEHSGCENQIETNKTNIASIWTEINKIKNRPPVWMSLAFAAALGVIGWFIK